MTIKNLVLSGGAYKGFYTIGALKYLSKVDFYKIENIEKIYGTSVGSFISAVLCLKLNFDDILEYAINRPWHKSFKFSVESLLDIINKKGFIKQPSRKKGRRLFMPYLCFHTHQETSIWDM